MITIGPIVGIAFILLETVFFQDYWHPPLLFSFERFGGIEDFLFGVAAGGVGTALYDLVFHKRFRKKGHPHRWIIPILIISELSCIGIFFYGFNINSIYASSIGFLIPAFIIMMVRKDLVVETILSAMLGGLLLIFSEMLILLFAPTFLQHYFLLYRKVPLLFGIVPLTEFLWGASFAGVIGPFFDFDYGDTPVSFQKQNSKSMIKKRKKIRS